MARGDLSEKGNLTAEQSVKTDVGNLQQTCLLITTQKMSVTEREAGKLCNCLWTSCVLKSFKRTFKTSRTVTIALVSGLIAVYKVQE